MKPFLSSMCAAALLIVSIAGCTDEAPSDLTPGLGGASITKYVAVGNSLTAGYQSNALYESAQIYSYPNLIAQQLRAAGANIGGFEQPIYGDPGNADPVTLKAARYELISLVGPVIGPAGLAPGAPKNSTLARPYDNFGLPGAPLAGFMDTVGTYQGSFGALVVRSAGGFPKSVQRQTLLLNPNLITFWLGANDVLGFATSGGSSPSAPTPTATFTALYTQALDTLRKSFPNAIIVAGNIPDVGAIPFFTTIGPKLQASLGAALTAGYVYYQKRTSTTNASALALDSTQFSETVKPLITLVGGRYAALVGSPTFAPHAPIAAALGLPYATYSAVMGVDSTKPFALSRQNPFPHAYVLDALEQGMASSAVTAFNGAINTVAGTLVSGKPRAKVVDFYTIFNDIKAQGYRVAGEIYTADYVTGGLFSLDGVHPSSRGYGVVANEFIRVINKAYGTQIPYVNITTIPGIPAPLTKAASQGIPGITEEGYRSLRALFKQSNEF